INWGDGTIQPVTGNPTKVTHIYASGINHYTISATALDDVGATATANTLNVKVGHVPPVVTLSGPASINEQQLYTLNLSAVVKGGHNIATYAINWGDGTAVETVPGTQTSATHTYARGPRTFTIQATATDDIATYAAKNMVAVSVKHPAPVMVITGPSTIT